jgi:lysophospholipase L1-like esterase
MKAIILLTLTTLLLAVPARPGFAAETKHDHHSGRWEKEIAAYEAKDKTNPPPTNGILFIGSSTIRMWSTLATDFPGQPVINRGFGGSEIADSTYYADRILFPYSPKAIFFRAGGNDIAAGEAPEAVFQDFKDFVTTVHAKLPDTDIFYISWNPTPSRWQNRGKEKTLNDLVKDYATHTPHLEYIEASDFVLGADGKPRPELFRADRLHFSPAGYKLLVKQVAPYLPKQP